MGGGFTNSRLSAWGVLPSYPLTVGLGLAAVSTMLLRQGRLPRRRLRDAVLDPPVCLRIVPGLIRLKRRRLP